MAEEDVTICSRVWEHIFFFLDRTVHPREVCPSQDEVLAFLFDEEERTRNSVGREELGLDAESSFYFAFWAYSLSTVSAHHPFAADPPQRFWNVVDSLSTINCERN